MNIGCVARVVEGDRVDDALRLQRRGGVVQVHQRFAVDGLRESWEILTETGHIRLHFLSLSLLIFPANVICGGVRPYVLVSSVKVLPHINTVIA